MSNSTVGVNWRQESSKWRIDRTPTGIFDIITMASDGTKSTYCARKRLNMSRTFVPEHCSR